MARETRAGITPPDHSPQQRVISLLRRSPSDAGFTKGTISFTNAAVEASLARYSEVLLKTFPNAQDSLTPMISSAQNLHVGLPASDFLVEDGEILIKYPNFPAAHTNDILKSIHSAEPDLGVLRYAGKLFVAKDPRRMQERYPWFNTRLKKTAEVGQMSLDDPRIQFMAVGYIAQVAKNMAVDEAHDLLKRASLFGGVSDFEKASGLMEEVKRRVGNIRADQTFIAKSFDVADAIAQKAGIEEDQQQLLLDVAFIRNRAFDQSQEFTQALEPLILLIGEGKWVEALELRSFLLKHFSTSFPEWRRQSEEESHGQTFESFKDLARAVASHTLTLDEEDVPETYRAIFRKTLTKKVDRVKRENEKKVLSETVDLSAVFIKELTYETSKMMQQRTTVNRLNDIFGRQADEIKGILTDETRNKHDRYENFYVIIKLVNPEIKDKVIEDAFDLFFNSLRSKVEYPNDPPFDIRTLRSKNATRVLEVEYYPDKQSQIMWHQTDNPVDFKFQGRDHKTRMKNYKYFGGFVYNMILAGLQPISPEHPILNAKQIGNALKRAHEDFISKNPAFSKITIQDYLHALFNSYGSDPGLSDTDPVVRFVKTL